MSILPSHQAQIAAITEDGEFHLVHIDTCLGSYLQDHHNRDGEFLIGAYVDGTSTIGSILDEVESTLNQIAPESGERGGYNHDKALAAIEAERIHQGAEGLAKLFDASLDVPAEDEEFDGESCQAWFLIAWDATEEEDS